MSMKNAKNVKVLITSVPPEAKGGIVALQQVLYEEPAYEKFDTIIFPVASANPFDERLFRRIVRILAKITEFTILLLRDRSIRIVHINTAYDPRSRFRDALFVLASRLLRRNIVLQIHQQIEADNNRILAWLTRYIYPLSNKILVFSSESKKKLADMVSEERIEIIPNAVNVRDFRNEDKTFKKDLSIPSEGKIVLFLSRLIRQKGVYDLIEAIGRVIRENGNVYFIFAGDGPERHQMETTCTQNGIGTAVRFTGHIPYRDVIRAFSCADVFVLPSYSEGMPMVILQALAAGVPIISTRVGAIADIVKDGVNGFLVEPHAPEQLAKKILFLIDRQDLMKRIGDANIQLAVTEFDRNVLIRRFEHLYLSL